MMIIPVIFCTVVIGIGQLTVTAVGKVGGLAGEAASEAREYLLIVATSSSESALPRVPQG